MVLVNAVTKAIIKALVTAPCYKPLGVKKNLLPERWN